MTAKFNFDNLDKPFEADWPVVVSVPQDGGGLKEETFTVRFRLLGDEDKKAADEQEDTARETLRRAMVGLGKGEERELTDALKEQLLEVDFVRVGLARAYGKFCTGIAAKKLTAAARLVAVGETGEHEALSREDAEGFIQDMIDDGWGPEAIAKARAQAAGLRPAEDFLVHPDNVRAVRLFLALQTQWRTVALSTLATAEIRVTGLDYAVLQPVARMEGLGRVRTDDFRRIRFMEAEALVAWRERREARR